MDLPSSFAASKDNQFLFNGLTESFLTSQLGHFAVLLWSSFTAGWQYFCFDVSDQLSSRRRRRRHASIFDPSHLQRLLMYIPCLEKSIQRQSRCVGITKQYHRCDCCCVEEKQELFVVIRRQSSFLSYQQRGPFQEQSSTTAKMIVFTL